jgi:WD40-like Beta Propeller Repeat
MFLLAISPALCASLGAMSATSPTPASADVFGPISLVSENTSQQSVYAHDPAISGDGRYVAFDGSFGGITGVWRKDLQTGIVEPVAVEDPADPAVSAPDAELPSISENGRYVSFTTTARLDSVDDINDDGPDVYVRDMDIPVYPAPSASSPAPMGAFTLASAVDGSTQGLTYEPSRSGYGSIASGRSALSANGREVVFVTTAVSNLDGPGTPALQVAVRDLDTDTTQLVSVAYDPATGRPAIDPTTGRPEPVSDEEGGLVYGAVYSPTLPPLPFRAPVAYALQSSVGASISADGSTVAWMGQNISEQAPALSDELLPTRYSEPLWRRIGDGPQAATRRITGGSDPANPACAASGETALPPLASLADPCQGPFATEAYGVWSGGTGNPVPQLSADGSTVAFLANAPPVGATFGEILSRASDLYVATMAEGVTRTQALRPLTELASGKAEEQATTAPIVDLGVSPDGSQVAFTTQRTVFPLGSPAYVTAPAATPGMVELFDVDLANETLTRVTHSFAGGAGEAPHGTEVSGQDPYLSSDGALSPSFSDDGDILAFSSTAANLVYGDGNTPAKAGSQTFDGSDAFIVPRELFPAQPAPQFVSSPPSSPPFTPVWRLDLGAFSRPNGTVVLEIQAPGAGTLRTGALSAVRVMVHAKSRSRVKRASAHGARARVTVAERTVATSDTRARGGGLVIVTLKLDKRYSALASARGGLSATATITFSASAHPTLRESLAVIFQRTGRPPQRRRVRAAHTGHGRSEKGHR